MPRWASNGRSIQPVSRFPTRTGNSRVSRIWLRRFSLNHDVRTHWQGGRTFYRDPQITRDARYQVKLLVFGREGQLARALREATFNTATTLVAIGRPDVDVVDAGSVEA